MDTNLSTTDLAAPPEPAIRTSGEELFRIEGVYTGLGAPIPGGEVTRWLLVDGPHIDSEVELFDELCWRLLGDGVPLWRASLHIGTLHPQIRGVGARWWRDRKVIEDYRILHGSEATDEYRLSPIRMTVERGAPRRRRLDGPILDFPLLEKIRKAGGTDYFALALNRTFRRFPVVAWTTDRPDGFSAADIAKLEEINPALAAIVDTRAVRRISENLLDTYLGPQAGRRILAGQIFRAQGERMRAVIMMTDLRGFTGLSDRLPGDAVIELLDDYFDAIVSPIQENKGEVLKFMGDGVLAIFPTEDDEDFAPSSLRALAAATQGLDRLATINQGAARSATSPSCASASGCIWARSSGGNVRVRPTGSKTSPQRDRAGGQPRLAHRGSDQASAALMPLLRPPPPSRRNLPAPLRFHWAFIRSAGLFQPRRSLSRPAGLAFAAWRISAEACGGDRPALRRRCERVRSRRRRQSDRPARHWRKPRPGPGSG